MIRGVAKLVTAGVEILYAKPVAFAAGRFGEIAERLNQVAGFPLQSDQVRARVTDTLYDYELAATFFGSSASFLANADGMRLNVKNGQCREDVSFILGVLARFGEQFAGDIDARGTVNASVHSEVERDEDRREFLSRFSPSPTVIHPGALGWIQTETWPHPVRVLIEPSFSVPKAIYISWYAPLDLQTSEWKETMGQLLRSFNTSASVYGLEIGFQAGS